MLNIKEQHGLKAYSFFYNKVNRKDSMTIGDIGINADEIISIYKNQPTATRKAASRLKSDQTHRSYNRPELHTATTAAVIGATMVESQRLAEKIEAGNKEVQDSFLLAKRWLWKGKHHSKP